MLNSDNHFYLTGLLGYIIEYQNVTYSTLISSLFSTKPRINGDDSVVTNSEILPLSSNHGRMNAIFVSISVTGETSADPVMRNILALEHPLNGHNSIPRSHDPLL
ncbi:hypothetical protein NPIL_122751 [Nephila pilipes]|uniref:Uncharacterized protein n=1 Tax=Nephila pilipes TaxID=299642 RepID=A0A8X6TQ40_NEPPI|nr:hypothetical protein NPIL_122751 [Nephila pilipes]